MVDKSGKILLVDDEQDTLMLLSFQLQRAGYHVILAENGREALQKVELEKPALLILDRRMPDMDGLEICRRVRQSNPQIFVILLTALGNETDRIAGLEAGADDYLAKPFSPKELILRVQAMLRRNQTNPAPLPASSTPPTIPPTIRPASPGPTVPLPPSARADLPATIAAVDKGAASNPPTDRSRATQPIPQHGQNVHEQQLQLMLQEASKTAQAHDIERARQLYLQILKLDRSNENALMWLAWYTNDPYEGCRYLEQLVAAHPENVKAREFLEAGRLRVKELDQLISDSNVLSYWQVAEQMQDQRVRTGVDKRATPILPVGQLLLKKGFITPQQLETAVNLHEMFIRLGEPKKLGEVLLEYGYLTQEQLSSVLKEQQVEFNSQFY